MRPAALVRLAVVMLAAGAMLGTEACAPREAPFTITQTSEQNVLLVTVDTLRADALGSYGGRAATPHLDALASSGARFTFAHAHAVMTLPSHATILTGLYPFQHGVRDNSGYRLGPSSATLAKLAKDAGFATGAFVGAFPLDSQFGLDSGFDVYDDALPASERLEFVLPERRAGEVVTTAGTWIRAQQRRWIAWVHLFDPHAPYAPPPPYDARYGERPYEGEIAYVDHAVGTLVDIVRSSQKRPTFIVVTADHGEGLGEHDEPTHGVFAYESTLRVPLILAQLKPGGPAVAGRAIDASVRHVDILPTILEAVRIAPPPALAGRSLIPVVMGNAPADPDSYFEALSPSLTRGWAPLTGIIAARQKYIDLPIPELYELESDPAETRNVFASNGERARAMSGLLQQQRPRAADSPSAVDPATARRLAALGYVSGGAARKPHYSEDDDPKRLIDVERMLHEAVDLAERGRTAEAVERYRHIIARRRGMAVVYEHLVAIGTSLVEDGRPAEGRAIFAEVLASDPANVGALESLGTLWLMEGNERAARQTFERALAINPASAPAHNGLGVIALRAGRTAEAVAHWRAAVKADAADFDSLFNLATELMNAGRMDEARPLAERFIAEAPRDRYANDIGRLQRALRP